MSWEELVQACSNSGILLYVVSPIFAGLIAAIATMWRRNVVLHDRLYEVQEAKAAADERNREALVAATLDRRDAAVSTERLAGALERITDHVLDLRTKQDDISHDLGIVFGCIFQERNGRTNRAFEHLEGRLRTRDAQGRAGRRDSDARPKPDPVDARHPSDS